MTATTSIRVELPDDTRHVRVRPEECHLPLTEVLDAHGLRLNTRCGGQGVCDGCEVELFEGSLLDFVSGRETQAGACATFVRACRYEIGSGADAAIRVPRRSLAVHEPLTSSEFRIGVPFSQQPLFDGTCAAAIDLGTTSVTVAVFDLEDGTILATESGPNAQFRWGQDVLSRVSACQRNPAAVAAMQQAVCTETIGPLLKKCLKECGERREVAGATIAGNTVMLHLLAGQNPSSMGCAPFTPVFTEGRQLAAEAVELKSYGIASNRPVHLLPSASAYLGADVVGGAVATGLAYQQAPCILLDLGTNGEIILKHGPRILGCATAAGPAFEGTGLTCGMTAARGAISKVRLNGATGAVAVDVIGDESPQGICGSAYIDFLAECRCHRLLDQQGRIRFDEAPAFLPLRDRVAGETALRIATDAQGRVIAVTEGDIALLLQAKAAVAAGVLTLVAQSGLEELSVQRAYVAGAFGTHLNPANAVDIGLLPEGLRTRVEAVGNTSLAAAYMAALDRRILDDLESLAKRVEVVELNDDDQFESRFIDHLALP